MDFIDLITKHQDHFYKQVGTGAYTKEQIIVMYSQATSMAIHDYADSLFVADKLPGEEENMNGLRNLVDKDRL